MKNIWTLLALLATLLAVHGCEWGSGPGGGTEGEGLSGTVVDPAGRGIANARVLVFPESGSGPGKRLASEAVAEAVLDSARTDARGRYRFDGLPSGVYALLARVVRQDSTFIVLARDIAYEGGKRDLGPAVLQPAGRISLTLRQENGLPVTGAKCSLAGLSGLGDLGGFEATSDAFGKCLLGGLPEGTFQVAVERAGLKPALSEPVRVRAGRTVNGGEIELEDEEGPEPVANVLPAAADAPVLHPSPGTPDYNGLIDLNGGALASFGVGSYDVSSSARVLVRFRLPQGLSPSRISKAVIRMHVREWILKNVQGSIRIDAHRVLRPWIEGSGLLQSGVPNSASINGVTARERYWTSDRSATWNQLHVGLDDIDASASPVATTSLPSRTSFVWDWDVTALAREWAADSAQNHGVLLLTAYPATNPQVYDYPDFISREAAGADSLKPRLLLEFEN